jgi:hypothetical protein
MSLTQLVRGRQNLAMLFHLVSAEKFRPQWRFIASVLLCPVCSAEARTQMRQASKHGLAAHLQL